MNIKLTPSVVVAWSVNHWVQSPCYTHNGGSYNYHHWPSDDMYWRQLGNYFDDDLVHCVDDVVMVRIDDSKKIINCYIQIVIDK